MKQYERVKKLIEIVKNEITFEPFVMSNVKMFKYEWIWQKSQTGN